MKAYFVSEKLHNFERGGNPRTTMDIGQTYLDTKFIEETPWDFPFNEIRDAVTVIDLIKNYRGFPILVLRKNDDTENKRYFATTTNYQTQNYRNPKEALKDIKFTIFIKKIFKK
jgi:hypothetical protein